MEYRPTHRLHHRYLGQERDPDRVFYLVPARRGALTNLLLQDLLGVTAFRRATSRISGTPEASGAPAGLDAPKMLSVGLHARIVGRPGRIAALERFLDYVRGHERVWICRRVDIAKHWMTTHPFAPPATEPSAT